MEKDYLTLKGARRSSGDWSDDDFDVLTNGEIVGRVFRADVSIARPWMCTRLRCNARGRHTAFAKRRRE
jgi:hypothetical protein